MIWKFLSGGPCQQAAEALQQQFVDQPELLPHVMNYDGSKELLTLDRLVIHEKLRDIKYKADSSFCSQREEYKTIPDDYLTRLLRHLLEHCKDNGDARNRRIRSLKDGDENLLTMLTAFEGQAELEEEAATYGTLYELNLGSVQLRKLPPTLVTGIQLIDREIRSIHAGSIAWF